MATKNEKTSTPFFSSIPPSQREFIVRFREVKGPPAIWSNTRRGRSLWTEELASKVVKLALILWLIYDKD